MEMAPKFSMTAHRSLVIASPLGRGYLLLSAKGIKMLYLLTFFREYIQSLYQVCSLKEKVKSKLDTV